MSLITANDVAVIGGSIMMPLNGVWTADLQIDQVDGSGFDAGTAVTLKCADGFEIKGTVAPDRTGSFLDSVHVRLVGGKGGTAKTVQPRAYVQPSAFVRDVLNGLCNDAGESLSSTVDSSFTSKNLTAWSVFQGKFALALNAFLSFLAPDFNWRFVEDGTLWVGSESWASSSAEFDVLSRDPMQGTADLGVSTLAILPGVSLNDVGNVYRVEYLIAPDVLRAVAWTVPDPDEQRSSTAKIVAQEMSHVDYFALYDAVVNSQSADGTTLDVTPNDSRLGGMQRVPLRHGLPGCTVMVNPGATIRIGWDNGDPRKPYAALWNGGESLTSIRFGGDPSSKVATQQDLADLGFAILNATVVPNDGGASLRTTILTGLPDGWPRCSPILKTQGPQ